MKSKYLGKDTPYQLETYSPLFLDAVKRNSPEEAAIYFGHDYWNAYEFSYLNSERQPVLESLEIKISMTSIYTVESKSLKLYLASFFNKKFNDPKKAYALIAKDLSKLLKTDVSVTKKVRYQDAPKCILLNKTVKKIPKNKVIKFEGFRSICPVTSQPDWANIYFYSTSNALEPKPLLKLLKSYRLRGDFHEACTTGIAQRLVKEISPKWLRIGGYWYPRGGIPIDVFYSYGEKPEGVWVPDQGVSPYRGRG